MIFPTGQRKLEVDAFAIILSISISHFPHADSPLYMQMILFRAILCDEMHFFPSVVLWIVDIRSGLTIHFVPSLFCIFSHAVI